MESIDYEYLNWLKDKVERFDDRGNHEFLFRKLYVTAVYSVIKADANREADGIALRDEYSGYNPEAIDGPCSFLEFLIALAKRMNYIYARVDEDCFQDMFWLLLENLEISLSDEEYIEAGGDIYVDERIHAVLDRTFDINGVGGLFPLKHPRQNQRRIEIWYQMNQYLTEVMKDEGRL